MMTEQNTSCRSRVDSTSDSCEMGVENPSTACHRADNDTTPRVTMAMEDPSGCGCWSVGDSSVLRLYTSL